VYVVGAVNLPGFVPHQEQMTLLDAFTRARWLNPAADIKKVSIVRVHQGKIVTLAPDVQALINRNDRSQNVALNSGDTVIVPFRRPSQTSFLNQFNPLSLFGYVAPFVYR
jgi:protein involved in polysaccharide export with SLBB domain